MNAIAAANACNAANNTTIGAIVVTRKIVDKIRRAVVTSHFARSLSTAAKAGGSAAGVGAGDSGAH